MAAGIKLKELIDAGIITENEAKIGYVGAYHMQRSYRVYSISAWSKVSGKPDHYDGKVYIQME